MEEVSSLLILLLNFFFSSDIFLTEDFWQQERNTSASGLSRGLVLTSAAGAVLCVSKLKLCGKDTGPCSLSYIGCLS